MSKQDEHPPRHSGAPDVSVVVSVYNTMPYLTTCLTSLVEQSIGLARMEIIAVDDGSTDGSGRELDRFARRYPDTVHVIRQANSGGPAAPCNRGLERATGRYVFFVGADDYLGREALERLVSAADEYGSDVMLGRAVGVNSRHVNQAIFATSEVDISLFDSPLPWALSNTKLFRRELIERHRLRYREDMPVGSDQPFTLEACFRARRISVLADYEFYYAVRRLDSPNLTYRCRHTERLHSVEKIMNFAADLIQPGKQRDAVLMRHFTLEVAKLLEDDFLRLDPAVQERVQAGVGKLVEQYLTDNIRDQLGVETRLRLSIAGDGNLSDLLAVIRQDAEHGVPPTVVDGDRWYAAYPGFRNVGRSLPDNWFDVTDVVAEWIAKLDATSVSWESLDAGARALTIIARSPLTNLAALCSAPIRMSADNVSGQTTAADSPNGTGTTVQTRFSVDQLLAESAASGERRTISTHVSAFGTSGTASLRAPGVPQVLPLIRRRGARLYAITPTKDHSGKLMIAITPVTARRVIERMRRWWLQRAEWKT